jgi:hypothetical protein
MKSFIAAAVLTVAMVGCGGGGEQSAPPFTPAAVQQAPEVLAFEELWEPRTAETGVFGTVSTKLPLGQTPDGSDPQEGWIANNITGRWGALAGLDGTTPGLPDTTGLGGEWWHVANGKLVFTASNVTTAQGYTTGGFALVSKQTFPRDKRIVVEADVDITSGAEGSFAGLTLISGEGDYREIAFRRTGSGDLIKRNTPLRETMLGVRAGVGPSTFRIDYDPILCKCFAYMVNGVVLGTEELSHEAAYFGTDPHVGLYFTDGNPIHGTIGPVRVWTSK